MFEMVRGAIWDLVPQPVHKISVHIFSQHTKLLSHTFALINAEYSSTQLWSDHSDVIPGIAMGQVDGKLFCKTAKTDCI